MRAREKNFLYGRSLRTMSHASSEPRVIPNAAVHTDINKEFLRGVHSIFWEMLLVRTRFQ